MASTTAAPSPTKRPTPLDMPKRRPTVKVRPVGASGRTCGCGAPATERIVFSKGDSRWYCMPCS